MTAGNLLPLGPESNGLVLSYNGVGIRNRGEMLSLTDMWKAAGADRSQRPAKWFELPASRRFIEHVAFALNVRESDLFRISRGRGGITFAHWQVGIAYAKYLSDDFHMWCNTVVRERMEGRPALSTVTVTDLASEVRSAIGGITKAVVHAELTTIVPALVRAELAAGIMRRNGKTAGQIWRENRFPPIKNIAAWFGNRLEKMGCRAEGNAYAEMGETKARLFDPDKAKCWLDNGGRHIVSQKIAERRGQGRLRLVLDKDVA